MSDAEISFVITLSICIPILLCSFVGNVLVIVVLSRSKKCGGSPNTCLLMNLAFSDLIFAAFGFVDIAIPAQGQGWLMKYISHALVSIYLLTALAVERYFAILKPFVHKARAVKSLLRKVTAGIWIAAAVSTSPGLILGFIEDSYSRGGENMSLRNDTPIWLEPVHTAYIALLLTFGILLPCLAMTVCYGRVIFHVWFNAEAARATNVALLKSRRKVTKLFIAVTLTFIITWTPSFGRLVIRQFGNRNTLLIYEPVSTLLALLGAMANPVLYSLRSPRFRQEVKDLFVKCRCSKRRRPNLTSIHVSRSHRAIVPV